MSYSRRFQWGKPYLLTDMKEGVFDNEPAMFVGRKDSDMECPTMCAVCGQPLGAEGYDSFFFRSPNGRRKDMMIGKGCIRDRIMDREIDIEGDSFTDTWKRVVAEFPQSGRWYGTFLHHCIAKPYVRNRKVAEGWDESVLNLCGVRYIMETIDGLRDDGWDLDAEMRLDCGNVDLLATHPDRGTIVFDWKSDLSFENHEEYIDQVCRYMSELNMAGMRDITGYIVWITDRRLEQVTFKGDHIIVGDVASRSRTQSLPMKCTLTVDMDGGDGIRRKKMTEYSHHRTYGDEVSFYIPPFEPSKHGYDFMCFEAPPYREGQEPQRFDMMEVKDGIHVSFICSKKRRSFKMTGDWKRIRPFKCTLEVHQRIDGPYFFVGSMSEVDDEGNDYVEFDVSEINGRLNDRMMDHATLVDDGFPVGTKMEWESEELRDGMKIRIPCIDECSHFTIDVKTVARYVRGRKGPISQMKARVEPVLENRSSDKGLFDPLPMFGNDMLYTHIDGSYNSTYGTSHPYHPESHFTSGRIYESGGRYYGIYRRIESARYNAVGKVDVAEVDCTGRRISRLEWRYVYTTPRGKEFIYGLTDRGWKVYTKNVLSDLHTDERDRYGENDLP